MRVAGNGMLCCLLGVLGVLAVRPAVAAEPGWTMYRGNAQRTGNVDGKPGPANPAVLWVHPSKEHFIASPTPAGDRVFFTGLGPFNVSTFYCFATDPKADPRTLWTKTTPFIKMPSVSSPAVVGDKLIFGDGMHQTDGATLYCLSLATGRPLWQLPVPGELVHLEGSPTVADGRVYLGGGNAGVLCVDMNRVTLEGKEMDLPAIQKILDQKWAALQAKFEADKKKDPTFAVPPSDDQLPKPAPVLLWEAGQGQVARGRPGDGGRRPRAGGVGLSRQGAARRPRPVLPRRQDRRHRLAEAAEDQPVGRPIGGRQDGRGQRQHHRPRPQGHEGARAS